MNFKGDKWVARDGTSIDPNLMTNAHLKNAVLKFEKQFCWERPKIDTRNGYLRRLAEIMAWLDELRGLAAEYQTDGY